MRRTALALALVAGTATTATPKPDQRCPLMAPAEAFAVPSTWRTRDLEAVRVGAALPATWKVRTDGRVAIAESPDGKAWLTVRRGDPGDEAYLDRARQAVELTELGPSQLSVGCEARLTARLRDLTRWPALRVSVTRRAFGERRRSFALFAALPQGTMTAVLTVKWRRDGEMPMALVRGVLRGLHPRR